ncbi:MAG TPA: DinB family protein [Longimicrobiales bacterium]|nr:DinB family protein [Longimicrobiales bacterium]
MSIFTNNISSAKEEAGDYTAAVLGLVEGRDAREVLRTSPAVVHKMISGADPSALAKPERDGKWSVRQVIAHLADSDVVLGWRLRQILSQDTPQIIGYDQDAWADRLHYADADPHLAVETYSALRRWNLRLLENASAEELKRYGVHSERGNESVAHMINMYAGHDILHQRQIERILGTSQPAL